jgi:hypothetical protein
MDKSGDDKIVHGEVHASDETSDNRSREVPRSVRRRKRSRRRIQNHSTATMGNRPTNLVRKHEIVAALNVLKDVLLEKRPASLDVIGVLLMDQRVRHCLKILGSATLAQIGKALQTDPELMLSLVSLIADQSRRDGPFSFVTNQVTSKDSAADVREQRSLEQWFNTDIE